MPENALRLQAMITRKISVNSDVESFDLDFGKISKWSDILIPGNSGCCAGGMIMVGFQCDDLFQNLSVWSLKIWLWLYDMTKDDMVIFLQHNYVWWYFWMIISILMIKFSQHLTMRWSRTTLPGPWPWWRTSWSARRRGSRLLRSGWVVPISEDTSCNILGYLSQYLRISENIWQYPRICFFLGCDCVNFFSLFVSHGYGLYGLYDPCGP